MIETVYFALGSWLFYTVWYAGLGWWVADPNQGHSSLHFWTRTTKINDLPRETRNAETTHVLRQVSYPWLIKAVRVMSWVSFGTLAKIPVASEIRTVALLVIALVTPFVVVYTTYRQMLLRFIPLLWGWLIGLSAVAIFVTRTNPWGVDLTALISPIYGEIIISGALFALTSFALIKMIHLGYTGPTNWVGRCVGIMVVGDALVVVGLLLTGII
jgi:hypothetical protein